MGREHKRRTITDGTGRTVHGESMRRGGRVRKYSQGGRTNSRGQGSHNHTINTGDLQMHYHHAPAGGGWTDEAYMEKSWEHPFDDDVGFAFTEPGGGHMGHRNIMKRGGRVKRFESGGHTHGYQQTSYQQGHTHWLAPGNAMSGSHQHPTTLPRPPRPGGVIPGRMRRGGRVRRR